MQYTFFLVSITIASMKIAVIGGAGYIGCHVVLAAQKAGHDIIVYDNLSQGVKENLPADVALVEADIFDKELEQVLSDNIDAVIHLAAHKSVSASMADPHSYARNNIVGTIRILDIMQQHNIQRFVFSSSAAVYGQAEFLPMTEEHPTEPDSFYGYTKREIERVLIWYDKLTALRSAVLRYFNVIGYAAGSSIRIPESEVSNVLPVIMAVACGRREEFHIFGDDYSTEDGTGVRDYIHVTDIADAHVRALDYINREDSSVLVNLGIGRGYSVREMINAAKECSGISFPVRVVSRRPGDPASIYASAERARTLLGWEPQYTELSEMVDTAWQLYRDYYGL